MTTDTNQAASFGELPTLARWSARGAGAFLVVALVVAVINLGPDPGDVGYSVVGWSALLAAVVLGLVSFLDRRALAGRPVQGARTLTFWLWILTGLQLLATLLLVALSLVPDGLGRDTVPVCVLGLAMLAGLMLDSAAVGRSWRFQKHGAGRVR